MMSNRAYAAVSIKNERVLEKSFSEVAPSIEVKKEDMELILIAKGSNITTVPYNLYVYRNEIQRKKLHVAYLSQAKIDLTMDLIVKSAGDIHTGLSKGIHRNNFMVDMFALTREFMYLKKLQQRVKRTEESVKPKTDNSENATNDKQSTSAEQGQEMIQMD